MSVYFAIHCKYMARRKYYFRKRVIAVVWFWLWLNLHGILKFFQHPYKLDAGSFNTQALHEYAHLSKGLLNCEEYFEKHIDRCNRSNCQVCHSYGQCHPTVWRDNGQCTYYVTENPLDQLLMTINHPPWSNANISSHIKISNVSQTLHE